jgi:CHAT domain-containing protein
MEPIIRLFLIAVITVFFTGCLSMPGPQDDLWGKGRYKQLERLMEQRNPNLSSMSSHELMYLCTAYANLKNYSKLFPCLDQWESNIQKGDVKFNIYDASAVPYSMRSIAFLELGDYERAATYAERAMKIVEEKDLARALKIGVLGNVALAHALKGNREEAIKAAKMLENVGTDNIYILLKADKAVALAKTYIALGDNKKALEAIEVDDSAGDRLRAQTTAMNAMYGLTELDGDMVLDSQVLPRNFMHGKCLYETGRINDAKAKYDQLLEKRSTKDNGEIYWLILYDRGRIDEKEGNIKEAIKFYTDAIEVIEQQRSTINTEVSKIGFVGNKQDVYNNLIRVLVGDKQYEKAFEYVERSKSRALVDLLASKKDFAVNIGDEKEIRELLARSNVAEIENLAQDAEKDVSKTRAVLIKTREELRSKSPELDSLMSVTSLPIAEIQKMIPGDEALVEYYYNDKDLYAFILTSKELKFVRVGSENLLEDVRSFRKTLESPDNKTSVEIAGKLYKKVFQPLEASLDSKKLIIVSHGAMHYLPFNALHDGKNYLIDKYSIRLLPSASVIKYLKAGKANKAGDILVFGNPDLGDPRYDLVNAQNEAVAVAKMSPQSKVFLRKEATLTAFKKYSSGFNYIHFATHGQFNSDDPLKSALLLAKDAESDGMLTVDRLYSTKLDADLVTLSACETGLSKIANGDDLVGLTRGFLYAGSSSIIASLWKVDDFATSQLMTRFYKELEKSDKRDALRTAQLETKKNYPHPYYWAPFQLTGNAN